MKASWNEAPSWAMFMAMDGNGWWTWFEHEPEWDEDSEAWCLNETSYLETRYESAGIDESEIDWDHAWDTLESRP